jgi:hypothetical protein
METKIETVHLRTAQEITNFVFEDKIKYQFIVHNPKLLNRIDVKHIKKNGHELIIKEK